MPTISQFLAAHPDRQATSVRPTDKVLIDRNGNSMVASTVALSHLGMDVVGECAPLITTITGISSIDGRKAFYTVNALNEFKLVFRNFSTDGNTVNENALQSGRGQVTYSAGFEYGADTYAVTFGGKLTAVLDGGGAVISDPIICSIPADTVFYVRTRAEISSAKTLPIWKGTLRTFEGYSIDGSDLTKSNGVSGYTTGSDLQIPSPYCVLGSDRSIFVVGDSIVGGVGDGYAQDNPYPAMRGWMQRWTHRKIGCHLAHYPGGSIAQWNAKIGAQYSLSFLSKVNKQIAVIAFGSNDINSGATFQNMIDRYTQAVSYLKSIGFTKVYATDVIPRTTSTDGWTTEANQTPISGFEAGGVRDKVNAWFRSSGLFNGVIPVNTLIASGNVFKPNTTAAGIHPNSNGHALMAQAAGDPLLL